MYHPISVGFFSILILVIDRYLYCFAGKLPLTTEVWLPVDDVTTACCHVFVVSGLHFQSCKLQNYQL